MNLFNLFLIIAGLFFLCYAVEASSCLNMSTNGIDNLIISSYVPTNIDISIYNRGDINCEDGIYDVFIDNNQFKITYSDHNFLIESGKSKKIRATIVGLIDGNYFLPVITTRYSSTTAQMGAVSKTSSIIKVIVTSPSFKTEEPEINLIEKYIPFIFLGGIILAIIIFFIRKNKKQPKSL
jgi:hypothetical protein